MNIEIREVQEYMPLKLNTSPHIKVAIVIFS